MQFENSVTINRPVQEVFDYVTDLENSATWQGPILEAHQTSSGPTDVGATGSVKAKYLGRQMDLTTEVTSWNPPSSLTARSTGGPFPVELSYSFVAQGNATRLTMTSTIEPGGFFKLAGPALEPLMRRQIQSDLETLKTVLESSSV